MGLPEMPPRMLALLQTKAGHRWFRGVWTPRGWRLRSKTTGRFVSVWRAEAFVRGIGRVMIKTEVLREQLPWIREEFWTEFILNRDFRREVEPYLREAMGYPQEEFL